MFVSSNLGTIQCITFSKYEEQIKECIEYNHNNEIWCSCTNDSNDYPCLAILVRGEYAVVNYFSENNNEMFSSVGDLSKNDEVEFEDGQYEVAANQVIPTMAALECALQFFHTQERPSCIEWEEL
ncbi:Imm1 family immunity protein [Anaerocolumna sp.]|uniref:Imm1 family immunity protein n=1 Tax=Anaerocolumna sp. TaxID=2041569 RepID=UPI0028AF72DB|nr:Imm1 family immunity protein [Anaerocolumna sp.]